MIFDDTASQFSVNVAGNVAPTSMTFSNATHNYTIGSTGGFSIVGTSSLITAGSGTVTLNNVNTFTGPITISAGQLVIGGSGQLGAGTNAGAITDNGILNYNSSAAQTLSGVVSGSGQLVLNSGSLTLSAANTFIGSTIIPDGTSGATLHLTGGGSLASANIYVGGGGVLDVSGIAFTLGNGQNLEGKGAVNGSVNAASGSGMYPGTNGVYGTITFSNNLTLATGALAYFDLGTLTSGPNDQIVVNGNLILNGNIIHLKAPNTSASLATGSYTLFTSANPVTVNGSLSLIWDVSPVNAANYSIGVAGNSIVLQYSGAAR